MGSHSTVTADSWKGQLNFERPCTFARSEDRCSLIEDLDAWNSILHELGYELVETCPGKLSLGYLSTLFVDEPRASVGREVAFLLSWLIEHHCCIDDLRVFCTVRPEDTDTEHAPARLQLRPPPDKCIRSVDIRICKGSSYDRPSSCYLLEEDIEALRGIEQLKICCCDAALMPALSDLLGRNSCSLKLVEVAEPTLTPSIVDTLLRLKSCESLTVSCCWIHKDSHLSTDTMTGLLRCLKTVKNFTLQPYYKSDWDMACIGDALKVSGSLTAIELYLHDNTTSLTRLFAAVEVNSTLKTLHLELERIEASSGDAMESALSKNASLVHMELNADIDVHCVVCIARALSTNISLQRLEFVRKGLSATGVLAMCQALHTNKTLKKLVVPEFTASQAQRAALAELLEQSNGYTRVLLPLAEPDLQKLSRNLASLTSCPEEISQIDISSVSDATLKLLFDAVVSSSGVHTFNCSIDGNHPSKVAALCGMLKASRFMRRINVASATEQGQLRQLLIALENNKSITEVTMDLYDLTAETASAMSDFFAHNRTITAFKLFLEGARFRELVKELSIGISMNPIILEFYTDHGMDEPTSLRIYDTLRKNRTSLNRAIDFAVFRSKDRRCAEAFERFFGRPCLLANMMKMTGQSETEALLAIESAENFLRDYYLVITGVVRRSLACNRVPREGATQCDELNANCWRAITRYLKVSDVIC